MMKDLSKREVRFADYLLFVAKPGDNPRGDFIRDARDEIAAGRFPTDNTWARVLMHVRLRGGARGAGAVVGVQEARLVERPGP